MTIIKSNPVDSAIQMIGGMNTYCTNRRQVKLVVDDLGIYLRVADLRADPFYDEQHGLVLAIPLPNEANLQSVARWMEQPMVKAALQELLVNISGDDGQPLYVNTRAQQILEMFWPDQLLDPRKFIKDNWSIN